MKLTKAIELQLPASQEATFLHSHDFVDAIRLGIQAIKAIQALRAGTPGLNLALLPGETPEAEPPDSLTTPSTTPKETQP